MEWTCLIAVALICGVNAQFPFEFYNACVISGYACYTTPDCPSGTEPVVGPTCGTIGHKCCSGTPAPVCGVPITVTGRIVNGQTDLPASNPWLVRVFNNGVQYCGGVLIDKNWVAVDAYCLALCVTDGVMICNVKIGDYSSSAPDVSEEIREIVEFYYHPDTAFKSYNELSAIPSDQAESVLDYNVGLMKLNEPIIVKYGVNTACQPRNASPCSICVVAGFGTTDPTNIVGFPDTRQVLNTRLVTDDVCLFLRNKTSNPPTARCGFLSTPDSGICFGDQGGAVVCQGDDDSWSVEGILAFYPDPLDGISICSKQFFVYTDMNEVWPWISSVIDV